VPSHFKRSLLQAVKKIKYDDLTELKTAKLTTMCVFMGTVRDPAFQRSMELLDG